MVVYTYNPRTREDETDTQCCEFKASLSYRCCFKRLKFRVTYAQGSAFNLLGHINQARVKCKQSSFVVNGIRRME